MPFWEALQLIIGLHLEFSSDANFMISFSDIACFVTGCFQIYCVYSLLLLEQHALMCLDSKLQLQLQSRQKISALRRRNFRCFPQP